MWGHVEEFLHCLVVGLFSFDTSLTRETMSCSRSANSLGELQIIVITIILIIINDVFFVSFEDPNYRRNAYKCVLSLLQDASPSRSTPEGPARLWCLRPTKEEERLKEGQGVVAVGEIMEIVT